MIRPVFAVLLIALSAGMPPAAAEPDTTQSIPQPSPVQTAPPPPSGEDARYTFHRMGDRFVRLDSRTGQLAQCGWAATGWSCKAVPDERAALESEIGRLQRENAELKRSLLSRGLELPAGVVAEAPPAPPVPPANIPDPAPREPKGPTDADLDRAISFVKNVWRRLVDMVADLQRDIQKKG